MLKQIAIIAALVGTHAAGDVIVFVNDNASLIDLPIYEFSNSDVQSIDVTAPAAAQPTPGTITPTTVGLNTYATKGSVTYTTVEPVVLNGSMRIAGESFTVPVTNHPNFICVPVRNFAAGESVGPSTNWDDSTHPSAVPGRFFYNALNNVSEDWFVDETCTMGVEFMIDGQTHYGFVTYEFTKGFIVYDSDWTPTRWGYETDPDTALVIPSDCPADLAEPFGTLNIFDLQSYIGMYNAQDSSADLAEPFGVLNIFDVQAYINLYNAGCP